MPILFVNNGTRYGAVEITFPANESTKPLIDTLGHLLASSFYKKFDPSEPTERNLWKPDLFASDDFNYTKIWEFAKNQVSVHTEDGATAIAFVVFRSLDPKNGFDELSKVINKAMNPAMNANPQATMDEFHSLVAGGALLQAPQDGFYAERGVWGDQTRRLKPESFSDDKIKAATLFRIQSLSDRSIRNTRNPMYNDATEPTNVRSFIREKNLNVSNKLEVVIVGSTSVDLRKNETKGLGKALLSWLRQRHPTATFVGELMTDGLIKFYSGFKDTEIFVATDKVPEPQLTFLMKRHIDIPQDASLVQTFGADIWAPVAETPTGAGAGQTRPTGQPQPTGAGAAGVGALGQTHVPHPTGQGGVNDPTQYVGQQFTQAPGGDTAAQPDGPPSGGGYGGNRDEDMEGGGGDDWGGGGGGGDEDMGGNDDEEAEEGHEAGQRRGREGDDVPRRAKSQRFGRRRPKDREPRERRDKPLHDIDQRIQQEAEGGGVGVNKNEKKFAGDWKQRAKSLRNRRADGDHMIRIHKYRDGERVSSRAPIKQSYRKNDKKRLAGAVGYPRVKHGEFRNLKTGHPSIQPPDGANEKVENARQKPKRSGYAWTWDRKRRYNNDGKPYRRAADKHEAFLIGNKPRAIKKKKTDRDPPEYSPHVQTRLEYDHLERVASKILESVSQMQNLDDGSSGQNPEWKPLESIFVTMPDGKTVKTAMIHVCYDPYTANLAVRDFVWYAMAFDDRKRQPSLQQDERRNSIADRVLFMIREVREALAEHNGPKWGIVCLPYRLWHHAETGEMHGFDHGTDSDFIAHMGLHPQLALVIGRKSHQFYTVASYVSETVASLSERGLNGGVEIDKFTRCAEAVNMMGSLGIALKRLHASGCITTTLNPDVISKFTRQPIDTPDGIAYRNTRKPIRASVVGEDARKRSICRVTMDQVRWMQTTWGITHCAGGEVLRNVFNDFRSSDRTLAVIGAGNINSQVWKKPRLKHYMRIPDNIVHWFSVIGMALKIMRCDTGNRVISPDVNKEVAMGLVGAAWAISKTESVGEAHRFENLWPFVSEFVSGDKEDLTLTLSYTTLCRDIYGDIAVKLSSYEEPVAFPWSMRWIPAREKLSSDVFNGKLNEAQNGLVQSVFSANDKVSAAVRDKKSSDEIEAAAPTSYTFQKQTSKTILEQLDNNDQRNVFRGAISARTMSHADILDTVLVREVAPKKNYEKKKRQNDRADQHNMEFYRTYEPIKVEAYEFAKHIVDGMLEAVRTEMHTGLRESLGAWVSRKQPQDLNRQRHHKRKFKFSERLKEGNWKFQIESENEVDFADFAKVHGQILNLSEFNDTGEADAEEQQPDEQQRNIHLTDREKAEYSNTMRPQARLAHWLLARQITFHDTNPEFDSVDVLGDQPMLREFGGLRIWDVNVQADYDDQRNDSRAGFEWNRLLHGAYAVVPDFRVDADDYQDKAGVNVQGTQYDQNSYTQRRQDRPQQTKPGAVGRFARQSTRQPVKATEFNPRIVPRFNDDQTTRYDAGSMWDSLFADGMNQ